MDILTYALAKSYTDKALLGVGTIKGAPCTVKSQTEDDEYVYVTLGWENSLGTSEETVVKIKKGADGAPGEPGPAGDPGPQGISITKIEKIKTEDLIDTYQISFSDNTTFEYTISNGSTDYLNITNKPSIEGVELTGNKTFKDLNIASADALTATDENLQNLSNLIGDKTSLPAPTDTVVNNIASVDAKVDAIIDDNEAGLAKTFSSDKITKTFATLEEANKRIPQYDVLPAPTEAFGGKVVQFIGATTEDYIHNYFYECTQVEGNYKWVNVAVQNIPTKVSELTNDSNFVTETELNAKGYLTEHQDLSAYATKEEIPTVPSKVSELSNDSNYQTAEQVNSTVTTEVAKIVADAPEDLNTLKEMSDWIAGHEDNASAMNSAISDNKTAITALQTGKADKSEIPTTVVELTDSADYAKKTDLHSHENKTVLDGITSTKISNWDSAKTHADSEHAPSTAQENVIETVKVNGTALTPSSKAVNIDLSDYAKKTDIPKSLPANGGNADTVNNHNVETNVPADAVFTDTVYDDTEVKESIAELNSNLDTLEFGEQSGGKNLIDVSKVILGDIVEGNVSDGNNYITDFVHLEYGKNYILSNCYKSSYETAWFTQDKKYIQRTFGTTITPPTNDCYYARIEYGIEQGINAQLEEGTVDTPYKPYIPSVKMLAEEVGKLNKSLSVIGKCKNLLNPTLQTNTQNGVTCTANGDGTYTLNGTSTNVDGFKLKIGTVNLEIGKKYKLIGFENNISSDYYMKADYNEFSNNGNNGIFANQVDTENIYIRFNNGVTFDNVIVKPMLTTNLNATYDDFVPYTGDGDTLTHDVAQLKNDIGNLTGDIDAKTVNGHTVESNVPADAKFTDTIYDDTSIQNKLTTHTHDNRYYTETEVNNLLNGKANSSHSHGAYELPIGSIFLSSRKVAPSYGNWEYLGTIQNLFSDLPLIQAIGEGYVYNRTS